MLVLFQTFKTCWLIERELFHLQWQAHPSCLVLFLGRFSLSHSFLVGSHHPALSCLILILLHSFVLDPHSPVLFHISFCPSSCLIRDGHASVNKIPSLPSGNIEEIYVLLLALIGNIAPDGQAIIFLSFSCLSVNTYLYPAGEVKVPLYCFLPQKLIYLIIRLQTQFLPKLSYPFHYFFSIILKFQKTRQKKLDARFTVDLETQTDTSKSL